MSDETEVVWTAEEQAVIDTARAQAEALQACIAAGGRAQEALIAAMPEELRESAPMMAAMGFLG